VFRAGSPRSCLFFMILTQPSLPVIGTTNFPTIIWKRLHWN
jgi:hypothetical protein